MQLPAEMYKHYVERRKKDYDRLKLALDKNSVDEFKVVGHQIKGNASSFGFGELASIGLRMEELSLSQISSLGPKILQDFKNWISFTENKFQT